ncbi:MAG: hypothetical protein PHU51_04330 [Candidatus Nanoarchaeia archaeon]|nr:hypothetical protein [Candidatus Nanoarchaeia archaeon]
MIKQIVNTITLATLLGGAVYVGEKVQPINSIQEFTKFYNTPLAKDTPRDYRNWKINKEIENGELVLYLDNKVHKKRITERLIQPSIGEKIDKFVDEKIVKSSFIQYYAKEIDTFKQNIKEKFK